MMMDSCVLFYVLGMISSAFSGSLEIVPFATFTFWVVGIALSHNKFFRFLCLALKFCLVKMAIPRPSHSTQMHLMDFS